jgi:hypothetical protein
VYVAYFASFPLPPGLTWVSLTLPLNVCEMNRQKGECWEDGRTVSVDCCSMWPLASCLALFGAATAWLCFLSTDAVNADEVEGVAVQLPGLGALRGSLNTSAWTNRTIYQFQGIPFAKPPVGNLRFKVRIVI